MMTRTMCVGIGLTFLAAAGLGQAADTPVTILCLGDSITKGVRSGVTSEQTFESHLQAWLTEHVTPVNVINSGIGGERTDQALKRLAGDVIARRPDLVCVMYGTNDSAVDVDKTEPRLDLESYTRNLGTIVDRLRAADIQPVLMTSIPLCTSFSYMSRDPYKERGPNHVLIDYVHAVRTVALAKGVPLVDHFAAWSEDALMGADLNAMTTDGCHPNPDGHERIAATMYPLLAALLGGQPALPEAVRQQTGNRDPAEASAPQPKPVDPGGNLALHCTYAETAHNAFGYAKGLTDGVKDSDAKPAVYATDGEPNYPKITTIDLEEVYELDRIVVHNAKDGSTKTVTVSVSADGETFADVGTHEFGRMDGAAQIFPAKNMEARYVRLTFRDSWGNTTHGSPDFMFLREVEVFGIDE